MSQVLERTPAPEAIDKIEATLNYIENDGNKIFTVTGGPRWNGRSLRRHA